jgi:hypothetical protein
MTDSQDYDLLVDNGENISDWGENLLGKTITFYRGSL